MNWFEQDYKYLLEYADYIIRRRNLSKLGVTPAELVNEAYLKFHESGLEYNIETVKKYVSGNAYKELSDRTKNVSFDETYTQRQKSFHDDICCNKCHEIKPFGAFRTYNRNGFIYTSEICNICLNKEWNKWYKENKEKWCAYMKERRKPFLKNKVPRPIHDLWKEANKRYIQKQKENLTDIYIKSLFTPNQKRGGVTAEMIQNKRDELLIKRMTIA